MTVAARQEAASSSGCAFTWCDRKVACASISGSGLLLTAVSTAS